MSGKSKFLSVLLAALIVFSFHAYVQAARDDHSNTFSNATKLKKNAKGRIDFRGDLDVFRINMKKGRTYSIEVSGKADVQLKLFDDHGDLIGADTGYKGKVKPKLFRIVRDRELVYVQVAGLKPKNTGRYEITVSNKKSYRGKPLARADHAVAYNPNNYRVLLFGGAYGGTTFDDMWEWNGLIWNWVESKNRPHSRSRHCMVYDVENKNTVMFGGMSIEGVYGDTWVYDGSDWTEMHVGGPEARQGATMVFSEVDNKVMLFGGHNGDTYYNDLWSWDGAKWKKVYPVEGETVAADDMPKERAFQGMAYDTADECIYVYGGMNAGLRSMNDLWFWDGEKWTEREVNNYGQLARKSAGFAYNIVEDSLYVYGGHNGYSKSFNDALYLESWWSDYDQKWNYYWYTTGWNYPRPAARSGHTFIYDPYREELLMFGGWNDGTLMNDTWILRDSYWEQLD